MQRIVSDMFGYSGEVREGVWVPYHFGMFNGGPNCLRSGDCEKWRCEDAPETRGSDRVELCASRMAGRSVRIVVAIRFGA